MAAVLITGGARRVGAALALFLAERGYDIALHYQTSRQEAEGVAAQVKARGRACELFATDLAQTETLADFMSTVKQRMPDVNALVNNASVFDRGEFLQSDEALFNRQFDVNLKAPVFLTQAFARHFGKGSVVNLLDSNVTKTHGSHFFYLMSKKALADFTIMAARALGPDVRVNGVCPGVVLPSEQESAGYEEKLKATNPLKRLAGVDAVCEAVAWLLAQEAVTGQMIFVDAGQHTV